MNATSPSSMMRLARLLRPQGNPPARGVDRLEGLALVLVVVVALLLLPIMLVFGSLTYADLSAKGEQQARTRHQTVATLTEDAPKQRIDVRGIATPGQSDVNAQWNLPDGSLEAGLVRADNGLKSGAKVEIWLDREGRLVDAPVNSADAGLAAVLIAAFGWLAVVGLLALAQLGLHRLLDSHRHRIWDQEWAQVEPSWNNYRR